jgi:hypothetical protein
MARLHDRGTSPRGTSLSDQITLEKTGLSECSRIENSAGLIYSKNNIEIYVKTWAQVLDENRARLQFFQERLEYQADKSSALAHLQEHYSNFLQGVLVTDEPAGDYGDKPSAQDWTQ